MLQKPSLTQLIDAVSSRGNKLVVKLKQTSAALNSLHLVLCFLYKDLLFSRLSTHTVLSPRRWRASKTFCCERQAVKQLWSCCSIRGTHRLILEIIFINDLSIIFFTINNLSTNAEETREVDVKHLP